MVWRCAEEGLDAASIAGALADSFGLSLKRAQADVNSILDQWQQFGLVRDAATLDSLKSQSAESDPPTDVVLVESGSYVLGRQAVTIRYFVASPVVSGMLAHIERIVSLFSGFAAPAALSPPRVIHYVVGQDATWIGHGSGYRRFQSFVESLVDLGSTLLCQAYGEQDWLCRLHGSIMAWGGGAIALPAPSGHGKSTLAAFLAARGWTYFGDDSTAIDLSMRALPLPTAISVKAGSLEVLQGLYPGLASLPEHAYGAKRVRYLAVDRSAAAIAPLPVAALVFPTYVRPSRSTEKVELRRLSTIQSVTGLMQAGLNLGIPVSAAKLAWVATFSQNVPAWSLSYSSLPEAEAALRSIGGK